MGKITPHSDNQGLQTCPFCGSFDVMVDRKTERKEQSKFTEVVSLGFVTSIILYGSTEI